MKVVLHLPQQENMDEFKERMHSTLARILRESLKPEELKYLINILQENKGENKWESI